MKHDLIIGIDFGHGEVSAHYLDLTQSHPQIQPLILDPVSKATTLISAIAYRQVGESKEILLGADAEYQSDVIAYFKTSPGAWDKEMNGIPVRQLTYDYFHRLMEQMRVANQDAKIFEGKDNPLLLVGCPTSADWLKSSIKGKYVRLIRQATGIQEVEIIPESRAAVFSAFDQVKGLTIDAGRGVAVFDFGSSTADFTYMQLGKRMMEHSWTLGGAQIEQTMLLCALEQADILDQVDLEQTKQQELELRNHKENFYKAVSKGGSYSKTACLEFVRIGEDGEPVCEEIGEDGVPVYETVSAMLKIDKKSMREYVGGRTVSGVSEDGEPVGEGSWYSQCCKFFVEMKRRLEIHHLPCATVVLTGGASRMDFVRDLCREIFSEANLCVEENPSYSVSIGLCYLGESVTRMPELIEAARPAWEKLGREEMDKTVGNITQKMAEAYFEAIVQALKPLEGTIKVIDLKTAIERSCKAAVTGEFLISLVDKELDALAGRVTPVLVKDAAVIVKELYPGLSGLSDASLNDAEMAQLMKAGSLEIGADSLMGGLNIASFATKIVSGAIATAVAGALLWIFSWIPGANVVIALFGGWLTNAVVTDIITEKPDYPVKHSERIAGEYKKKKDENISKLYDSILIRLTDAFESEEAYGEDYQKYTADVVETGKKLTQMLALSRFEEKEKEEV